jgi:C-terminal processing protease CtpA/Prc
VESVEEGSIADKAGLKAGDMIVAVNGTEIGAMKPDERLAAIRKAIAETADRAVMAGHSKSSS